MPKLPKYTKEGLPVVKGEVALPIMREIKNEKEKEYLEEIIEQMKVDNPFLWKFLTAKNDGLTEFEKEVCVYTGALIYKLLKSQAAANQMDYQFGEKEE